MTSTLDPAAPTRTGARVAPFRGWLWGAAAAIVANLVVFAVASLVMSSAIQVTDPSQQVMDLALVAVVAASIIPLFFGALLLWILAKFSASALRIWSWIVGVVAVLSVIAPVTLPVDGGSKVALAAMHLLTGAAAIWGQRFAASRVA